MKFAASLIAALILLGPPGAVLAQGIAFDDLRQGGDLPIEVNSDELQVDQATGRALFLGDVIITQGSLRLSADEVQAFYAQGEGEERGRLTRLTASGHVVIATQSAGIEANEGVYDLDGQQIEMTGNVVLTQQGNVVSGKRLVIDVAAGRGTMDGRVRTILQTGGSEGARP